MPDEPEAMDLLALMLLTDGRRDARTSPGGALVLLADQDRSLWNRDLIAEGQAIVQACLRRNQPGPYQIQAAIQAVHSDARMPPAPTGARSWRSTTSSSQGLQVRWSPSTVPWRSQRSGG